MANKRIIKGIRIDTDSIAGGGERRSFSINGTKNAVFNMQVINNHGHYYNFDTEVFAAAEFMLKQKTIKYGSYSDSIKFPKLPDSNTDYYDIYILADPTYNTEHTSYVEARYADGTTDINSSTGSNSLLLQKRIYQYPDLTLTLSTITPNSLTALGSWSQTNDTITLSRDKNTGKIAFSVAITVAATRNVSINRQPIVSDILTYVTRTIGSAALPIDYEDTSSSTYYRWPIDNVVGLTNGMLLDPGATNVTDGSFIANYESSFEAEEETSTPTDGPAPIDAPTDKVKATQYNVRLPGIKATGDPTLTNGVLTSQSGEVIFNKQQADALKDDSVKLYAGGIGQISTLTGYDVKFSDLKVELTKVTTTVDGAVSNSTSVVVDERAGIRNTLSTVTGIGIDDSSAVPTVASGAGAVNGSGTIVLSAAQTLEDGITLTFGNTSRTATITGNIEVKKAGTGDLSLYFNVENFLTSA